MGIESAYSVQRVMSFPCYAFSACSTPTGRAFYNCQKTDCFNAREITKPTLNFWFAYVQPSAAKTAVGEAEVGRLNLTCASPAPDANVGLRQLTANRRHDQVCAWFEAGCGGISGGIGCRRARAETMIACCALSIMRDPTG